jgi:acyl-ACP thioesterase
MKTSNSDNRKFRESFQIRSFDSDLNGRAKLTSICNFVQEISEHHGYLMHQGIDDLKANNMSWVLSRLKLQLFDTPKWRDCIEIETWLIGVEGLFGNREFKIYNQRGEAIAQGSSSWLVFNTQTKRLVRPQEIVAKMPANSLYSTDGHSLSKIPAIKEAKYIEEIHIHYSDIDFYQHVNNVKYIKWAIDACLPEIQDGKTIHDLEINYLHESKVDQTLELFKLRKNSSSQIIIKTKNTDIENCRAIINWK